MKERKVLSADEAREKITRVGGTIAAWARSKGLPVTVVYDLLLGRRFGRHGDGHRAAVLLGMKEGTIDKSPEKAARTP